MPEEDEDYDGGDASSNSDHEDPFSVSLQFDFHRYSIGFLKIILVQYLTPICITESPHLYNNILLWWSSKKWLQEIHFT